MPIAYRLAPMTFLALEDDEHCTRHVGTLSIDNTVSNGRDIYPLPFKMHVCERLSDFNLRHGDDIMVVPL